MKKKSITVTDRARLFSFFIEHDLLKGAKNLAKKEHRSVSSILNHALDNFLKEKKK